MHDLIEQKAVEQMAKRGFISQFDMSISVAAAIVRSLKRKGFHLVALDTRQYTKWLLEAERKIPVARQRITARQEREAKRSAGVKARVKSRARRSKQEAK